MTKTVKIGDRVIGGGNPILIQSMTNTKTEDVSILSNFKDYTSYTFLPVTLCLHIPY